MSILNFPFKRNAPTEAEILNKSLSLLLKAWFDFNHSIQDELLNKYPYLTEDKLNYYEQEGKSAKVYGHDLLYKTMVKRLQAYDPMTKNELKELYRQNMTNNYTWVNKSNLRSIYNFACYSLGHDGWFEFKKS